MNNKLPILGLTGIKLLRSSHASRDKGVCAMEAVAWLAGEEHSDKPQCSDPGLAQFFRSMNDNNNWENDEERTKTLVPLLPKLLGTNDSKVKDRAAFMRKAAIQVFATSAFESAAIVAKKKGFKVESKQLVSLGKRLKKTEDLIEVKKIRDEGYKVRDELRKKCADADAAATAAAYAAHAADHAADAATYAADAATAAAAYAAHAADAATATAAAYAADHAADAAAYATAAAYAAATATAAAYAADAKQARRKVLFQMVQVATECLDKYPADCIEE